MTEDKRGKAPADNPEGAAEVPAPEEALADKLAEQADTVTSQLKDLLPESPAAEIQDAHPVETLAESATPAGESLDAISEPVAPKVAETLPSEVSAESDGDEAVQPGATEVPNAAQPGSASEEPSIATGTQVESSSDDRLMSALAWLTMVLLQLPIVSAIQLLSTTTRDRPFQRHHAVTSLLFYLAAIVYEFVAVIVYTILGALTLGCGYACLWVIFFLPHAIGLYFALQAYNGKTIELPVLSNFGRQQGWM